ncbi:hypothetical protein PROFUN_03812 [Planoprotostelium fungivorum]|uniref:Uncharacterized protein n=1 Tax=Planoprotostelium fungivorum TaxID=1890364 RepID=A0A2P6NI95_9EUKA|nr:hypothetical protein PROFUN_03812 [Planoprotostelium fungivorum]
MVYGWYAGVSMALSSEWTEDAFEITFKLVLGHLSAGFWVTFDIDRITAGSTFIGTTHIVKMNLNHLLLLFVTLWIGSNAFTHSYNLTVPSDQFTFQLAATPGGSGIFLNPTVNSYDSPEICKYLEHPHQLTVPTVQCRIEGDNVYGEEKWVVCLDTTLYEVKDRRNIFLQVDEIDVNPLPSDNTIYTSTGIMIYSYVATGEAPYFTLPPFAYVEPRNSTTYFIYTEPYGLYDSGVVNVSYPIFINNSSILQVTLPVLLCTTSEGFFTLSDGFKFYDGINQINEIAINVDPFDSGVPGTRCASYENGFHFTVRFNWTVSYRSDPISRTHIIPIGGETSHAFARFNSAAADLTTGVKLYDTVQFEIPPSNSTVWASVGLSDNFYSYYDCPVYPAANGFYDQIFIDPVSTPDPLHLDISPTALRFQNDSVDASVGRAYYYDAVDGEWAIVKMTSDVPIGVSIQKGCLYYVNKTTIPQPKDYYNRAYFIDTANPIYISYLPYDNFAPTWTPLVRTSILPYNSTEMDQSMWYTFNLTQGACFALSEGFISEGSQYAIYNDTYLSNFATNHFCNIIQPVLTVDILVIDVGITFYNRSIPHEFRKDYNVWAITVSPDTEAVLCDVDCAMYAFNANNEALQVWSDNIYPSPHSFFFNYNRETVYLLINYDSDVVIDPTILFGKSNNTLFTPAPDAVLHCGLKESCVGISDSCALGFCVNSAASVIASTSTYSGGITVYPVTTPAVNQTGADGTMIIGVASHAEKLAISLGFLLVAFVLV